MNDLVLDGARSRVQIQTFAEGLFARLAHDLELECGSLSGSASRSADSGSTGTAHVEAPLGGMSVRGVLGKDGRVDERALSPSDRRDILAKTQNEVFHAGPDAIVRVEAHLDGTSARLRIVPPSGKAVETTVRPDVRADGEALRATGTFELSLAAIGSDVVKGPMGAFRVKDRVRIAFDVFFVPPQPA